ncbi:MAG: extracellular solute-binding protein [Pseudomonadota bacterium]
MNMPSPFRHRAASLSVKLTRHASVLLAAILAAGAAHAQTAVPKGLLEAAQKEGQVTWYETSVPEVGDKLRDAFEKSFPGVKLRHVSVSNAEQMSPRILQEARAGTATADVVQISADQIATMQKRGVLSPGNWAELGIAKKFWSDPIAVASSATMVVLLVNTRLVSEEARPKTWNDLLDPRWKGKISAWGNPYPFALLASSWGDEATRAYLQKFVKQEATLFPAPTGSVQAVVSGDLPIGIVLHHIASHSVKAGAPVVMKSLDVVPVAVNYSAIVKGGKSPNAARLLIWWLTTDEGAKAYESATNRGNVHVAATDSAKAVQGVKIAAWPFDKADSIGTLLPAYQEIIRAQR